MSSFDILVIGGGLLGRAIAYQLAKTGTSVGCIYQRDATHGMASAAAGGMLGVFSEVSAQDAHERCTADVEQRWAARQLYHGWVEELRERSGIDIPLKDGLFVVANGNGPDDSRALDAIRAAAVQMGSAAETVPADTIPGFKPQLYAYDTIFLPDEGSVDTHCLLQALDLALEQHEKASHIDSRATLIAVNAEGVEVTVVSGDKYRAVQVVLANGVEISQLLYQSGLNHLGVPPVFSGRGVSLLVQASFALPFTIRTPNRGFACGLHVVPRANNMTYLGATNRFSTTPDVGQRPTLSEVNNLLQGGIHEIAVGLRDAEITQMSVGHRPVTLDYLPLVGRTRDDRVLVATATYRNGVLLAPLVANLITEEIICPGTHTSHPFSPQRELKPVANGDMKGWLQHVSRSLYETISEPGGWLPYGRDEDLQRYFFVTLNLLLNSEYDREELLQKVNRLLKRAPLDESMPLLFDLIARHGYVAKD